MAKKQFNEKKVDISLGTIAFRVHKSSSIAGLSLAAKHESRKPVQVSGHGDPGKYDSIHFNKSVEGDDLTFTIEQFVTEDYVPAQTAADVGIKGSGKLTITIMSTP